jgi:hypothetical protein
VGDAPFVPLETLELLKGTTLEGHVVFDGKEQAAPVDLARIGVRLRYSEPATSPIEIPAVRVASDGTFLVGAIPPGRYLLEASVQPGSTQARPWRLGAVTIDGHNVIDVGIDIQPGYPLQHVVLSFTDRTTELTGRLLNPLNGPPSNVLISVFPIDQGLWQERSRWLRRPVRPASDGTFKFVGLPPGKYYVAAFADSDQVVDWHASAFMKQLVSGAVEVTLRDGEQTTQNVVVR